MKTLAASQLPRHAVRHNSKTKLLCCWIHLALRRKDGKIEFGMPTLPWVFPSSPAHSLGLAKASASLRESSAGRGPGSFLQLIMLAKSAPEKSWVCFAFISHSPFFSLSSILVPHPRCPRAEESSFHLEQIFWSLPKSSEKSNREDVRESGMPPTPPPPRALYNHFIIPLIKSR